MEAQSAGRRARARAIGWLIGGGAAMVLVWVALPYGAVLVALAAGEPDPVVADAIVGRWIVVVCGCVALGLFARHLGALRRASEDRFRRGFVDSPIGMAIISADWRWLEVNDTLCATLGRTREELIGRTPAEATHPDDIPQSRAVVDRARAGA